MTDFDELVGEIESASLWDGGDNDPEARALLLDLAKFVDQLKKRVDEQGREIKTLKSSINALWRR